LCARTGGGASVSTDDGASWRQTLSSWAPGTDGAPALLHGPQLYVSGGGLYRSSDCAHWTRVYDGNDTVGPLAGDPSGAVYAVLGTGGGIIRSADGQTDWTLVNHGLDNTWITTFAIDATSPNRLYLVATSAGWPGLLLFATGDGAAHWQQLLLPQPGWAIAANGDELIAAGSPWIFRSFNQGGTFVDEQLSANLLAITFDPTDATRSRLYGAGDNGARPRAGVFSSGDQGATWTPLPAAGFVGDFITVDPGHGKRLWAAGYPNPSSPRTLYRSNDAGGSWKAMSLPFSGSLGAFAIASSDGQTLFATVTDDPICAVVKSVDGGESWTQATALTTTGCPAVAASPSDPTTVYVATDGDGQSWVWKTSDGGQSWRTASNGLFGGGSAVALVIDPADAKTLYLATGSNGVFKTVRGGE
jgi:hypothetical protein